MLNRLERLFLHHPLTKSHIEEHHPGTAKETRDNTARNRLQRRRSLFWHPSCETQFVKGTASRAPRVVQKRIRPTGDAATEPEMGVEHHVNVRTLSEPVLIKKEVVFCDTAAVIPDANVHNVLEVQVKFKTPAKAYGKKTPCVYDVLEESSFVNPFAIPKSVGMPDTAKTVQVA